MRPYTPALDQKELRRRVHFACCREGTMGWEIRNYVRFGNQLNKAVRVGLRSQELIDFAQALIARWERDGYPRKTLCAVARAVSHASMFGVKP
jgi:hypothetical protein